MLRDFFLSNLLEKPFRALKCIIEIIEINTIFELQFNALSGHHFERDLQK